MVFDGVGKDTFMDSLDCLQLCGLMVTFGSASGPVPPLSECFRKKVRFTSRAQHWALSLPNART